MSKINTFTHSATGIVEYYQDDPSGARDRHEPLHRHFETFHAAKQWILQFPRDVWDGFQDQRDIDRKLDGRQRI